MNGKVAPPRDRNQIIIIGLVVVVTILAGLIIGFLVSGGLSGEPTAVPTTTLVGPSPSTTLPTTVPPTTLIPGQLSIPAIEDTHVNSGQPAEANGLEDVLEIENDPPENKQALVRFDVPAIPEGETIQSVTLRLFVVADTDAPVTVHLVDGDWSQDSTTGANAPSVGAQVAIVPPGTPEGSTVDVVLTDVVQGPGQYDFYLITGDDDSAEFASIESGTNPPLLVVDWGGNGTGAESATVPATVSATVPATQLTGNPVVLAGAGDIADCDAEGAAATAQLLDQVIQENGETIVFTTGDNVYASGTPEEFAQCYEPTWGRHKERTRPAPGNHEYNTADATGYFDYFGEAAGTLGQGYYSYQAGEWQVVVLNSNCEDIGGCEEGSPQEQWLREELAASDALCTIAYWHHPLFSSGTHGGDASVRPLFRALYEDGAELVLNGHDHNFERFAPQDPEGIHDPVNGIREFVVGTGGKGNRSFDEIVANSESRFGETFGILKLGLYSDGYEWEYIPETGSTFNDVGIGACH